MQLYTSEIGQQVLRNAGHARSSGVEGQIEWLLPHWRTGAASVGPGGFVNRSIYTEYFDAACAACIGKRVPHTPASGLNITLKGRFQAGPHTLRQGGYTLLDAALSWHPAPRVEVRAWAHNLTNKTVRNYGFTFGGTPLAQLAAGRTAGGRWNSATKTSGEKPSAHAGTPSLRALPCLFCCPPWRSSTSARPC